jgi:hypothetical protein
MPSRKPDHDDEPAGRRRAFLRTDLPSAAAIGALMGLVAAQESSGAAVAVVVAVVGCAAVLLLLALKRVFYGP